MAYAYNTQKFLEKGFDGKPVDFAAIFADKQQRAGDTLNLGYKLPQIVEFLKTQSENFTRQDQHLIDMDAAITKIVGQYHKVEEAIKSKEAKGLQPKPNYAAKTTKPLEALTTPKQVEVVEEVKEPIVEAVTPVAEPISVIETPVEPVSAVVEEPVVQVVEKPVEVAVEPVVEEAPKAMTKEEFKETILSLTELMEDQEDNEALRLEIEEQIISLKELYESLFEEEYKMAEGGSVDKTAELKASVSQVQLKRLHKELEKAQFNGDVKKIKELVAEIKAAEGMTDTWAKDLNDVIIQLDTNILLNEMPEDVEVELKRIIGRFEIIKGLDKYTGVQQAEVLANELGGLGQREDISDDVSAMIHGALDVINPHIDASHKMAEGGEVKPEYVVYYNGQRVFSADNDEQVRTYLKAMLRVPSIVVAKYSIKNKDNKYVAVSQFVEDINDEFVGKVLEMAKGDKKSQSEAKETWNNLSPKQKNIFRERCDEIDEGSFASFIGRCDISLFEKGGSVSAEGGVIDFARPQIGAIQTLRLEEADSKFEEGGDLNDVLHLSTAVKEKFGEKGMFPASGESPTWQYIVVAGLKERGWEVKVWMPKQITASWIFPKAGKETTEKTYNYSKEKNMNAMKVFDWFAKHSDATKFEEGGSVGNDTVDGFDVKEVLDNYMVAALWSSDDMTTGEEMSSEFSIHDIDPASGESMRLDVVKFLTENKEMLKKSGLSDEQIGHDFWLTRNGHGAGFWDRGLDKEVGDALSDAARAFKDCNLYSEDGKVKVDPINPLVKTDKKPSTGFSAHTDEWFDELVQYISVEKDIDPNFHKLVELAKKEATKANLEKFVEIMEGCKCTKPALKDKVLTHIRKVLKGEYKKEFKHQFGGKAGDVRKVSAASSFFDMFLQAATYESDTTTMEEGGSVKSKEIPFQTSNLYLNGKGRDGNGNATVKVAFADKPAFGIQTNGVLKNTQNALRSVDKISELSPEQLAQIEAEVNNYVKNYGSKAQKEKLHIYDSTAKFAEGGSVQKLPERGTPAWHQLNIAKKKMKENSAVSDMLGGMTMAEAKEIVEKYYGKQDESGSGDNSTATVLVVSSKRPLSTQLQKITGDSLSAQSFEDLENVANTHLLRHIKTGQMFVVFPSTYYLSVDKKVIADDLSWIKSLSYGIKHFKNDWEKKEEGGSLGKSLYVAWSSWFDTHPYDIEKIKSVVAEAGGKEIHTENAFGWGNQPEVVVFKGDKSAVTEALQKALETEWIIISEKDWRTKKMADGGAVGEYKYGIFTISEGNQEGELDDTFYSDNGDITDPYGDDVPVSVGSNQIVRRIDESDKIIYANGGGMDGVDYEKHFSSEPIAAESFEKLKKMLGNSGFYRYAGRPENEFKHGNRGDIAIVGKKSVSITHYTPNTKRYLGEKSFNTEIELAKYLDEAQYYAEGGVVDSGEVSVVAPVATEVTIDGKKWHLEVDLEIPDTAKFYNDYSKYPTDTLSFEQVMQLNPELKSEKLIAFHDGNYYTVDEVGNVLDKIK